MEIYYLASTLPLFTGEVPYGSLILVAYVCSLWGPDNDNISHSINWVVVLATPLSARSVLPTKEDKPSAAIVKATKTSKEPKTPQQKEQPVASGSGTKAPKEPKTPQKKEQPVASGSGIRKKPL
jgi:hypothetical protein